ncbi:transglycosylase domain-containing protein [Blastococcus sp. TF02A_35]|uniref:transglycosylase domain-containing protein n=1 Tax=Blastococcus sp. TF02A-35 TaxID=2559612 RepID=UPI001073DF29|nr:transglycosylase domain-containing protein [Blastococcus sp. TF02A_35]TFV48508.1 PASTA domain-containing protein [Blastococcus sp. TF02A_35]
MSENARIRTRLLARLAATIVVAGMLVAGLLLPWVGGAGLVARNSASLLDALPVELTDETPAGNTKVVAADGSLITYFYENNRTPVAADQIADIMKRALVDIEDSRFYDHNGMDVQGTFRALATNLAAGTVREGGSTITQQLVKQTLLQTATTQAERDAAIEQDGVEGLSRKLREARLALALEETYSKDEILTRYLNIVYFGQGAYGIQAAAQRYFSTNAADLTLPQAAMLAGLVQSPTNDDPITNPENAQIRRNQVLQRMFDLGHISEQELTEVSAQPVQVAPGLAPPNGCIDAAIGAFFCDFLYGYLTRDLGLTDSEIDNGGLTIQTTLRPDMQAAGDQAVLNTLAMGDRLVGTYTAVEPGTGRVLAMSNNRKFGCDGPECESVNFNVVPSKGSGSTFKVFTAAAALEQGYSKYYTLSTPEPYVSKVYRGPCEGRRTGGMYCVSNAGSGYPGTLDMEKALYMSSNTYFLALEDKLGSVEGPVRMAERMGMTFDYPATQFPADQIIAENRGSFTFGTDGVSPLDLASAYSTLAASGTQCDPTPVAAILDSNGEPLTRDGKPVVTEDNCTPEAIPTGVANTLNQMLRKDVEPGHSGQTAPRAYVPGHQIAGKTGTTNNNTSVAFVGYTPQYTASVLVFNSEADKSVGGFGGGKGATIWHDAMAPILTGQPMVPFPPEDPEVAEGDTAVVPACSSASACEAALEAAGFQPTVREVDSAEPAGAFLGTRPGSGSRVSAGSSVTIQVSNGSAVPAPAPDPAPAPEPAPVDPNAPPADTPPGIIGQPDADRRTGPDGEGRRDGVPARRGGD